ncbi:hypothetical protein K1T71_003236 [Dendrolimus kikuchii]|uniref:Uncharacterized protein n=1 Tax=Dendrolimus kikuchii TaxID=765133 RepID=A0ACC1DB83_9NEOP|nr:hypothetical protein K1T71_003236 [Dendrolimus kikuchii]
MESDALPLYTHDYSDNSTQKVLITESTSSAATVPVAGQNVNQELGAKQHFLGPDKSITTCHFCHNSVKTTIKHTITTRTHMTAALCAALFSLCCIPCCIYCCCDSAKNTDHYCPSCGSFLGTYEK